MHANPSHTNSEHRRPLETGRHLFQPPMYGVGDGKWSANFHEVVAGYATLTWDPAALLSYLTYGYVSGDRTLFQQVRRQPWCSTINREGPIKLECPPPHDFYRPTPAEIGGRLLELLESEAEAVCANRSDVYVLTSGGLDSRIVAGVMRRLLDQGRVTSKVHAVTWGRNGSRDVEIGKVVAEKLNFPWTHLTLGPEDLLPNIDHVANELVQWFRQSTSIE